MDIELAVGVPDDALACGRILHEAFTNIANTHNFPSDFPFEEMAVEVASRLLSHPGFYGVVARRDNEIIGSNFLDERSEVAGLGPITVATKAQNSGAGRLMMEHVLQRADKARRPGVRLQQAAYHNRTLALYARLGFDVRELCSTLQGPQVQASIGGCRVRTARADDRAGCDRVCRLVHGHSRSGEVADAVEQGSALVVERDGRISGYTTGVSYFGHSVGENNEDLKALIAATSEYAGPGFQVPARNTELLRWCLNHGLRIVHNLNLMTRGLYNEPQGGWLPSILM